MLSKMEKQILKVSYIYGLYQQIRYIILIFITLALSYYLKEYFNIIILLSGVILLRIIYGIIYYKLIRIEIYKDHLSLKEGVFTSSVNFIELYRVKDYSSYQSFFMKVFGIMNVTLYTSDKTTPILKLKGISKSNIIDVIRLKVENQRKLKGVREFD